MTGRHLPPWLLQAIGLAALVAMGVVWYLTDRASPLMIAAFGALVLLGDYRQVADKLAERWIENRKGPGQ